MIFLFLLLTTFAHAEATMDEMQWVEKQYPEKKLFMKSCLVDKLPFYKCQVLWDGKDKGCAAASGISFGNALAAGAAMGVGGAVMKKVLK